jgi:uncharacterized phage protein (TIGR02220 family)
MLIYRQQVKLLEKMNPEDFKTAFLASVKYGMDGELPAVDGLPGMYFEMVKPTIDLNNLKYENGKKGGRPKNQTITTPKPNRNQSVTTQKPERNHPEQKRGPAYQYAEVVEYLNQKAGTSFKADSKETQKHIRARMDEGFTLEDFKKVIDIKVKEWGKDSKMAAFLRPSTLFGPKFESYLNQKTIKEKPQNRFNNFHQREYDFDDLESRLLNSERTEGK